MSIMPLSHSPQVIVPHKPLQTSRFFYLYRLRRTVCLRRMPVTPAAAKVNSVLLALKPRQVLLGSSSAMKNRGGKDGNVHKASSGKELSLNVDQKVLLHQSVASYLERCGFSKSLKKFRSEAQILKDDSENSIIDLEEMCLRYLESKDTNTISNIHKDQDGIGNPPTTVGNMNKKNKRENNDNERDNSGNGKHGAAERVEDAVHEKEIINNGGTESNLNAKDKKQKLKKNKSNSLGDEEQPKNLSDNIEDESLKQKPDNKSKKKKKSKTDADVEHLQIEVPPEDKAASTQKSENACKGKKKNKLKSTLESVVGDETESKENGVKKVDKKKKKEGISDSNLEEDLKEVQVCSNGDITVSNNSKTSNDDTTTNEKKESKKRKRSTSEDEPSVVDEKKNENPENGKVESLKESQANEQSEKVTKAGEHVDKNFEKTMEENSTLRPAKKQRNGSQDPKTVKAFQRVKVDQIAYADERLQDNSYWAMDGAENGYGAKAQEILGQVKGRGFRHEKTKKKRGTYRGGKIDLDSHSVKFNYSDDE